jgi:hypothetical protein
MVIAQNKTTIHTHSIPTQASQKADHIWSVPLTEPFDELLISWNALRPFCGHYVILSRLLIQDQWTPWLLYAVWGCKEQFSFHDAPCSAPARSYQDQVEVLEKKFASGFCIRVVACGGATLESFYTLYACTSKMNAPHPPYSSLSQSLSLPVPKISQLSLVHPRSHSVCSPTSTTAVVQYLLSHHQLNPLQFAKQVYDAGFDIYGNWSFNVAQAFVELGTKWQCFCARMPNIEWLWHSLKKGRPVVVSVKGSLPGAHLPYSSGHLIVIKGYDAQTQHFLCMDPAFPSDEQTEVSYPWQAFIQAWENRHYLAYFFLLKGEKIPH